MNERTRRRLTLALAGLLALSACSKHASSTATTAASAAVDSPAETARDAGDAGRGKQIFLENCAACHGPSGVEGRVGASLHDERARKSLAAARAWIENPQPPMPKLYPGTLTRKDVDDVAAYVETL